MMNESEQTELYPLPKTTRRHDLVLDGWANPGGIPAPFRCRLFHSLCELSNSATLSTCAQLRWYNAARCIWVSWFSRASLTGHPARHTRGSLPSFIRGRITDVALTAALIANYRSRPARNVETPRHLTRSFDLLLLRYIVMNAG